MTIFRAQIGFPFDSALPRDVITLNPHYIGTDAGALAIALKTNLIGNTQVGATKPFTIKIYDAQKAPPSYPLATAANGTGFWTSVLPREVACCLSFFGTFNRPSWRGRLFIPATMFTSTLPNRPSSTQRDAVGTWATTLGRNLPGSHLWSVFSRKGDDAHDVTDWWVDDEWDTVRSRGQRPSTRTTGKIP